MSELDFKGKDIVGGSWHVSKLDLVGIVIELKHLSDFSNNVKITILFGCFLKGDGIGINLGANINTLESHVGPVLEGGEDAGILSLLSDSVARESVWGIAGNLSERRLLISGVKSPWSLVEHVDVELSLVVPPFHVGSMNSNDISESMDEWEVLKLGSIDDELGVFPSFLLGELRRINNFQVAEEHLVGGSWGLGVDGSLVWESGINDNTVETAKINGGSGHLGEFSVVIL